MNSPKRRFYVKLLSMSALSLFIFFLLVQSTTAFAVNAACHPYSVSTCVMPYPNDHFTPEQMEAAIPQYLLSQLPQSLWPSKLLKGRDGWSPSAAILFEAPYKIKESALPLDGGNVLKVFDMDDPHAPPVPVRVRLSQASTVENKKWQKQNPGAVTHQVIQAFPRSRFPFGHRLVAVLTTALKAADGTVPAAPVIPQAYAGLADELVDRGVEPDTILSLTEFTVATEKNTTGKLFEMIDVVKRQSHAVRNLQTKYADEEVPSSSKPAVVRNLQTLYNLLPRGVAAKLTGQVRLTSFRDPADGTVRFAAGDRGTDYWADFDLYLPEAAKLGKVPIIIYGHGVGGSRSGDSALFIAKMNGANGIATIAIDYPNHGSRSDQDGGYIKNLLKPATTGFITGMANQGVLDTHSLHQAILTSLANLDILPKRKGLNRLMPGYGKPDIDTNRIYYMGTSLGGVFGSGFVGSADNLDGAFLQITGTGIIRTLALSFLYTYMGFCNMVPVGATPSEAAFWVNYVQNALDKTDGNNLIHNVRNRVVGRQITPILVQMGVGDAVVHNDSSYAMAELAGLKQVVPLWQDVDYIPNSSNNSTSFALVQGVFPVPSFEVQGLDTDAIQHYTHYTPSAMAAYEQWLVKIRYRLLQKLDQ